MDSYGERVKQERKIDWLIAEHVFHAKYLDPNAAGILLPLEVQLPHYSTDIASAFLVEDEIERLNLKDEYVWALKAQFNELSSLVEWWSLIHATPLQRCLAALNTVGIGVGRWEANESYIGW